MLMESRLNPGEVCLNNFDFNPLPSLFSPLPSPLYLNLLVRTERSERQETSTPTPPSQP
jgi:hypothetical protein